MIIRAEKTRNYSVINNAILNDERLTFAARGLAAFLLTKPDSWSINREHLAAQGPDGVRAVRTMLKELRAAGYITQERGATQDGRFQWVIVLHEVVARNAPVDNAPARKGTLVSTDVVSTDAVISRANSKGDASEGKARETAKSGTALTSGKNHVVFTLPPKANELSPLDRMVGEAVRYVEDAQGLPIGMMQKEALEEALVEFGSGRVLAALEQTFKYKQIFNVRYFAAVVRDMPGAVGKVAPAVPAAPEVVVYDEKDLWWLK